MTWPRALAIFAAFFAGAFTVVYGVLVGAEHFADRLLGGSS